MVVKIYISGISGNKEVKKRQQRVLMILDSKNIKYEVIDITEPGREADKDFMQNNAKSNGGTVSDPNPRSPLPPQMFNDEEYCGDYDEFDLANEIDTLEQFLKLEVPPEKPLQVDDAKDNAVNGITEVDKENKSKEPSQEKEVVEDDNSVPAEESATEKDKSPSKEGSLAKESTPLRDENVDEKECSPEKVSEIIKGTSKETTPEKETERQKSVEQDESPIKEESLVEEAEAALKENSPEKEGSVNENGTASSRELSEEKEAEQNNVVERKKDNPSETLIQSEQMAAVE
ncbi:hypothetical protein K1T71_004624 [Dendrolimus kikuchii]|uniref:Uncharacterized protein n=1 Tax=Dendrolimus kikuchii TaxID=765133 RepID=A0ACC1D7Y5_9NEOP|nr:hypothetical protein K1T71_004624 [Dendrolimus kikuchii]